MTEADFVKGDIRLEVGVFACPVCYATPMEEVYQCREGHLLCSSCYKKVKKCPDCRVLMPVNGIRVRAIEKFLDSIIYKCPNQKAGCIVITERKKLRGHLNTCEFKPIKVCQALGIRDCEFEPESGKGLFKHLELKHRVNVLTSDDNVIQLKEFICDQSGSLESVYLFKDTISDKNHFLIYRQLPSSTCKIRDVTILCLHLGDTTCDLEDYRLAVKFTFNCGKKEFELKTTCPITNYRNIENAMYGLCPESGFEIPLKFIEMQAYNAQSTEQGENYLEFSFHNLLCNKLNEMPALVDFFNFLEKTDLRILIIILMVLYACILHFAFFIQL